MTEEEAKLKWCPFARVTAAKSNAHDKGFTLEGLTVGPFNRLIFGENNSGLSARMPEAFGHCLASDCMAWRWKTIPNPEWKPQQTSMVMYPQPNIYSQVPAGIDSDKDGYCGLASK